MIIVGAVNLGLDTPRGRWFFVEWAKVRTPNPSFARNTLFWEARDFEQTRADAKVQEKVVLLGSSQIYQATDIAILSGEIPEVTWEKDCLAGFGPMQYPWVLGRLLERKPSLVVCWLSEFDFYREDAIPVNRLRWASSLSGFKGLVADLSWHQRWIARGNLADLFSGALLPVWRNRDHFRRGLLHYWWDVSSPSSETLGAIALADSGDLYEAKKNLQVNVRRTTFVDVNFLSFERFARGLKDSAVQLLVVEGQTHPEAIAVVDPAFRVETRARLRKMSDALRFHYISEVDLPIFRAADFADGYHLNRVGRARWSKSLADLIRVNRFTEDLTIQAKMRTVQTARSR